MKKLYYEKLADQKNYIYFYHFRDMEKVKYKFFDNHIHKATELLVCTSGRIDYIVNRKKGTINGGDILFINSYDTHYYEYVGNADCYIVLFSNDIVADVYDCNKYELKRVITPGKDDLKLICHFLDQYEENEKECNYLQRKALAYNFFGSLLKYDIVKEKETISDKEIATRILEYVEQHYAEPLTLGSVAFDFGYSRNYFSNIFNNMIGVSFSTYINLYRLDKVLELKADNKDNLQMKDIIKKCGFNSEETFYRTYRINYKKKV